MAGIQLRAAELCPKDFNFDSRVEIGSGGMARVYRVMYGDKKEIVAVKVPHWKDSSTEKEVSSHADQECLLMSEKMNGYSRFENDQ